MVGATLLSVVGAWAQESLRFEVASVRLNTTQNYGPSGPQTPDGLRYNNLSLFQMVLNAYRVRPFQVVGLPAWTREASYDVTAKADRAITDAERMLMLRTLLVERFSLKARIDQREDTVYVLTRLRPDGPLGPALKPRPDCAAAAKPCNEDGVGARLPGYIRGTAFPMTQLTRMLSLMVDRVVIDETRIDSIFDVDLTWRGETAPPDDPRPSLFTAVEEQLGLKLTPQRRPVDVLVIESLDRATPQ